MNNNKAFSLIELSIVLIIIGLLVAGITGGQSLIESAKIRGLITEFRNYKQAVNAFYVLKYRMPGDTNDDGFFGEYSGDDYYNFFKNNYNKNEYSYANTYSGPIIELYLNKIIDFKPQTTINCSNWQCSANDKSIPQSKNYKDGYFYYMALPLKGYNRYDDFLNLEANKNMVFLNGDKNKKGTLDFAQKLDNKIDDNNPLGGNMRIQCFKKNTVLQNKLNNYDLIEDKKNVNCFQFGYKIDF